MKKAIYFLLTTTIGAVIFAACNNAYADSYDSGSFESSSAENIITFKVNGEEVKTTGWNISRFSTGTKIQLNITSNIHIDRRTINVNLSGDKAGIYDLSSGGEISSSSYGSYAPDYTDLLTRYSFNKGEFNITELDTVKGLVNGTFEGQASDPQGQSYNITDGKIINGILKPGIQKF